MENSYRFVSPEHKTILKLETEKEILPCIGEYVTVKGGYYLVAKVSTEHDFDNLTKSHVIYLDNIQDDV